MSANYGCCRPEICGVVEAFGELELILGQDGEVLITIFSLPMRPGSRIKGRQVDI